MNWFKKQVEERNNTAEEAINDLLLQANVSSAPITKKEALNIPTVSASVSLISSIVASLPIKLFMLEGKKVIEIEDDKRIVLLNDETGDTLNAYQFKQALVSDYLLEGEGFAYINRKRNNIESLHFVENSYISIMLGIDPIFKSYDISVNGAMYRDFEFLKLIRNTKDGITGNGIISESNKVLSVAYNSLVYEETLVKTNGNKKGFLKSDHKIEKDVIDTLKSSWKKMYSNHNSENIVVLNKGIDFQEASSTSVELQLNENKKSNAEEIAKLFLIPLEALSGKANQEVFDNFIKNAIIPILNAIENALNKDLLLKSEKDKSFYFAFDTKNLNKGAIEKRFKAYEIAIKNGWMQLDEVRYEEDLAPYGLEFIKLGLQDVLYNPKTGEVYTPNTDKTKKLSEQLVEGGEDDEDRDSGESGDA